MIALYLYRPTLTLATMSGSLMSPSHVTTTSPQAKCTRCVVLALHASCQHRQRGQAWDGPSSCILLMSMTCAKPLCCWQQQRTYQQLSCQPHALSTASTALLTALYSGTANPLAACCCGRRVCWTGSAVAITWARQCRCAGPLSARRCRLHCWCIAAAANMRCVHQHVSSQASR